MKETATHCLYLNDTFLFQAEGNLVDSGTKDFKGQDFTYAIFDQTIFYPQGGGQPADKGEIKINDENYTVIHVSFDPQNRQVIHYFDREVSAKIGSPANFKIDSEYRLLNAKAHTAGHLIGSVVQNLSQNHLIATVGNHMPNQYSVLFTYDQNNQDGLSKVYQQNLPFLSNEELISQINQKLSLLIQQKIPVDTSYVNPDDLKDLILPDGYQVPTGKNCRTALVQGLPPVPCGGTHIDNLEHFESIEITKISMKKNPKGGPRVPKLSYIFS